MRRQEQILVWDYLRKKYLVLSPEEWVRQHLVHHLHKHYGVPLSGIALEGGFRLNTQLKRSDILIYRKGSPVLLVECKAPSVKISQAAFDQAARYNSVYRVKYLLVSNGLEHFYAQIDQQNERYHFLRDLPPFEKW